MIQKISLITLASIGIAAQIQSAENSKKLPASATLATAIKMQRGKSTPIPIPRPSKKRSYYSQGDEDDMQDKTIEATLSTETIVADTDEYFSVFSESFEN